MDEFFVETERLILRKVSQKDFHILSQILKDDEVMKFFGHKYTDDDVLEWIEGNENNYKVHGYSYFLAIDKSLNEVVGQIGLIQTFINEQEYVEIGYILKKGYWGKGYATEGAKALLKYALDILKIPKNKIILEIRPENKPSIAVAQRLGAKVNGSFIKHYKGNDFLHHIYKF